MYIAPISFCGTKPVKVYSSPKKDPEVVCACCGNRMIDGEQLNKSWARATKPLSYQMAKGAMERWRSERPEVYKKLETWAQMYPQESLDTMLLDDTYNNDFRRTIEMSIINVCKENGEKISQRDLNRQASGEYFDILVGSRKYLRSSSVVIKEFGKYKNKLRGEKKETFEQLEKYALKYPRASLTDIINNEEIFNFHAMKDQLQRAESREDLNFHFNNIWKIVKKSCPEDSEYFDELRRQVIEMYDSVQDPKMRIVIAKKMYKNALEEKGCEKYVKKVFAEIDQMPQSFITKDSFLAYAKRHGYSDGAIMASLINPYVASDEHVVPFSQGGSNSRENIVTMCRDCNQKRGTLVYTDFVVYHPEMIKNFERQLKRAGTLVLSGRLPQSYATYPIEAASNVRKYSKGLIDPNITMYCGKLYLKEDTEHEEKTKELDRVQAEIAELLKKSRDLSVDVKMHQRNKDVVSKYLSEIGSKAD